MEMIWRSFMTWLWAWPLLATWDVLGLLIDDVALGWKAEYRHVLCARYAALEKNLEAGRLFLETRFPEPSWVAAWGEAEVRGLEPWTGDLEQFDCETSPSFRLYRQQNTQVPRDYPNWWVRRIWPESLEEEM